MPGRRQFTGLSCAPKRRDGTHVPSVGELPQRGEAGPARARGALRSEDAGTSSEAGVGIPRAESPRFPGEGSSSQGQPGPKPRPRGVGEGRRVDIPWPRTSVTTDAGTAPRGPGRVLDAPVRGSPPGGREALPPEEAGQPAKRASEAGPSGALEKPLGSACAPVPKPTQVGRWRTPRRAGGPRSRNSAKSPRNLGRRGAPEREPQRRGPGDCLPKTQDSAEGASRRIGSDACPVPEGHAEPSAKAKRRSQAPVNGGRNYNGPKVAKFLVG